VISKSLIRSWRHFWRFFALIQLLPALESGEETLVGGQAVLEGVMMRSPHAWGIAVRKPSGEIVSHSEAMERPSDRRKWMGWPVIRGPVTLGSAMTLGFRALKFSTNVALEELSTGEQKDGQPEKKIEITPWMAAIQLTISLGFFLFFYKFVPLLAATGLKREFPMLGNQILFNLVDGAIRIALFVLFIWLISRMTEMHRVFQYHGAEHKTVFAFEKTGEPVSISDAQSFSTFHPRCGTSFLITLMLISIVFYALVPVHTFWARFGIRLALLPLIVGISYELIRFAAKRRGSLFATLTSPGLWLQRITTQPPADDQVECAIYALDQAMAIEKKNGGELVIA
jgi:uncharacterized protein YqhQ